MMEIKLKSSEEMKSLGRDITEHKRLKLIKESDVVGYTSAKGTTVSIFESMYRVLQSFEERLTKLEIQVYPSEMSKEQIKE